MEMVRGGVFLVLVVGLGAGSGCSGSKPSPPPLSCTRSVAEFCSNTTALICSLTWDDVEAGRLMCVSGGVDYSYEIWDCRNYRRLTYRGTDSGFSFYYDAASGQLIAIVGGDFSGEWCVAGPPGVFEIPPCELPDGGLERIDCGSDGNVM